MRFEALLRGLEVHAQIVLREGQRLALDREGPLTTTEDAENAEKFFHLSLGACFARRWRATSYITTPAATETLSDGTLPAIGMETRKSHLRRTRSCRPLPSAPRTSAQSML